MCDVSDQKANYREMKRLVTWLVGITTTLKLHTACSLNMLHSWLLLPMCTHTDLTRLMLGP